MSGGANAFSPFWDVLVIQRPIDHEELAGRNLQSYSELLVSSNELRNRPHFRALLVYGHIIIEQIRSPDHRVVIRGSNPAKILR